MSRTLFSFSLKISSPPFFQFSVKHGVHVHVCIFRVVYLQSAPYIFLNFFKSFIFYPFTNVHRSLEKMVCGRWSKRDAWARVGWKNLIWGPTIQPVKIQSHYSDVDNPKNPTFFVSSCCFFYHIFTEYGLIVSIWGPFETNAANAMCLSCINN